MKKDIDLNDLYFYKGKFRTDDGLKRALIKDGTVWVSPYRAYYLIEKYWEYYYDKDMLEDYATDYELTTRENFNKWLREQIKTGQCQVCHTQWYHCDANDGIGTMDWWDTREAIEDSLDRWDPKYPDDFIERSERTWEEYVDTISDEEFKKFERLPDDKQMRIAMKWRINLYNKALEVNNEATN